MRPVLIVLVLLGLAATIDPSAAAPLARNPPAAPSATPTEAADDAPPAAGRATTMLHAGRSGDRRRTSYASCNRESHRQNLRGGARRRFLIRCKLGMERRKASPRQGEPAPAGKRP